MTERIEADVCVVGAGYAGLAAAYRLHRSDVSVVVLEARDRVGGRIWTHRLPDGTAVDRGGAFLAPTHDAMFTLAREMGVATYKTYAEGTHLLVGSGRTHRYRGLIPKIGPRAIVSIALAQLRLDRMAKTIPVEAPWTAERAEEWDATNVAAWIERSRIRRGIARDLFEMATRGLFTESLERTSLLHMLFLIRSAGGWDRLMSIEGGYQENLVDGGAGAIAERMAAELGAAVRLGQPVRAIAQRGDRVDVTATDVSVTARKCVVATPPALALEIAFDPALPSDRAELYRRSVAGPESKTLVVYDEPFWRDEGLSGQTAGPGSACEVTLDASPMAGRPGVIASFTFGPVAERFDALDASERRRLVLDELASRLGPRASSPSGYVETSWIAEPWTRGCSMAHFPPGVLTRYGHLLREPFEHVHWAGTETATVSHGAMDGAVRSGQRAADEILDRIGARVGAR